MAHNKVVFGDETLMDVSQDTVTPETLAEGVTAHNKDGDPIVGTMVASTDADTLDGWHFAVRDNGTPPQIGVKNTMTLVYTAGG